MTQDNKKRLIHLNGHFQAIAAMEMVDKALLGRNSCQMLPLSDFRAGYIESCCGKGIDIIRRDLNDLKA